MACLLLASSLLLGSYSCSTNRVSTNRIPANCKTVINTKIKTATYHAQIDFFGKHLSGLLVFKATSDTTERAIFMNETGFKFFDFEFTPATFTVKYCLPAMNKKIIIKTFQRDLGFLVDFKQKEMDHHKSVVIAIDSFQNGHPYKLNITDHPAHLRISMTEIDK